jgi:hypothetical protein
MDIIRPPDRPRMVPINRRDGLLRIKAAVPPAPVPTIPTTNPRRVEVRILSNPITPYEELAVNILFLPPGL